MIKILSAWPAVGRRPAVVRFATDDAATLARARRFAIAGDMRSPYSGVEYARWRGLLIRDIQIRPCYTLDQVRDGLDPGWRYRGARGLARLIAADVAGLARDLQSRRRWRRYVGQRRRVPLPVRSRLVLLAFAGALVGLVLAAALLG